MNHLAFVAQTMIILNCLVTKLPLLTLLTILESFYVDFRKQIINILGFDSEFVVISSTFIVFGYERW